MPQQAPPDGSPGGAPNAAPQPPGGVIPQAAPDQSDVPPADVSDPAQQGDIRPRLIPGTDQTSGEVLANPKEQAEYRQTMIKAGQMIHSRTSRDQILSSLHDPGSTVAQAVGRTAASILMTIDQQKQASGSGPLSHDILHEAARYVIPELMDVGISAGIFPIKPPEGSSPDGEVGQGDDPYNKEIRMALLEAVKVYGEAQLKRPDKDKLVQRAGDDWADGIRQEVSDGTASPEYMKMARARSGSGVIPQQSEPSPQGGMP